MLPATDLPIALPYPQTPATAQAWFLRNGVCKSRWARAHGFDRMTIADLLRGKREGKYGQAHRAAIALGLKPNPEAKAALQQLAHDCQQPLTEKQRAKYHSIWAEPSAAPAEPANARCNEPSERTSR